MASQFSTIRPNPRENMTTIQVSRDIQSALTKIAQKGETYNRVIARLISNFEKMYKADKTPLKPLEHNQSTSKQIRIGQNIVISKYQRATISITDRINAQSPYYYSGLPITLEISYNQSINREDMLYQIDLKIEKVIFDNEAYSPKEFFGVLQKDMVYCEEFVYYYLQSIIEILKIEFKKSNFFFKDYSNYFDLARWRTFLLNSKLSPEILSHDVESVLSDLKNEKTNTQLINDVNNSYYKKIKNYTKSSVL